ncbi:MAG: Bll2959 protein, partial [uncultured Acetobacteraceae bacterium]
ARARTGQAQADAGNPALLGRDQGRQAAAPALRRHRPRLLPAAPLQPLHRLAQRLGVRGERPRQALQLRHPQPPRAGLHAALRHRRGGAGGGAAHDDQHRRLRADAGSAGARHALAGGVRAAGRGDHAAPVPPREGVRV